MIVYRQVSRLAYRAILALVQRGFAAEVLGFRVATDAGDVQYAIKDLDLEHSQCARRPDGVEARAFRPVAGNGWRRAGKLQGAVWVDGRTPVDEFHVRNNLFDKAIETPRRAAGVDEIVAAA